MKILLQYLLYCRYSAESSSKVFVVLQLFCSKLSYSIGWNAGILLKALLHYWFDCRYSAESSPTGFA